VSQTGLTRLSSSGKAHSCLLSTRLNRSIAISWVDIAAVFGAALADEVNTQGGGFNWDDSASGKGVRTQAESTFVRGRLGPHCEYGLNGHSEAHIGSFDMAHIFGEWLVSSR
jgi:hypothetical protein